MSPPPPNKPQTILKTITQVVQKVQAKINFADLQLKPNAKVAELWVQEANAPAAQRYPLLGDYYRLGRSSRNCDITVDSPIVSQTHLSIKRDSRRGTPFVIRDENSTNGIYRGKRRIKSIILRHGDILTLGPPDLANGVRLQFIDPPPWYIRALRYSLYGTGGITALVALWVLWEWQKFPVRPLPPATNGPIVVYADDGKTPLRSPCNNRPHIEFQKLSEFSPYLPDALLASEDSRFYWHFGVDPIGILRAVVVNLRGGGIRQGASTLTQQVARSLFQHVGREDTAGRKLREAAVALKLETFYSKDRILLTYLNRVYLGSCAQGFEDAAQFYFGKSAKDVDLSEAATLVGILPGPNAFNPAIDYQAAVAMRNRVLERMAVQGRVSQKEAQRARRSRIEISPEARKELEGAIAPYYYTYVLAELRDLLGEELATEGNFVVETGLNLPMQAKAEAALRNFVETSGSTYGFSQGALVTLDARTGEIRALNGGVDFRQSQFNRATQAKRQPGSTFKLFAYTAALESGLSPGQTFACTPLNWGGRQFRGCRSGGSSLDMYAGMARSENVVALRVAQEVGLNRVVQTAKKLGVRSKLNPVPALVLGQSEVTVLEMTGAFGAIANNGQWNPPHAIKRVLDSGDCRDRNNYTTCRVVYSHEEDARLDQPAVSTGVAATITQLLRGVIQGGTGRGAAIGADAAGKTGTTDRNVDLWFVGFVPSNGLVTGVWLGNDDNSPTRGSSGQAAQLWGKYMGQVVR